MFFCVMFLKYVWAFKLQEHPSSNDESFSSAIQSLFVKSFFLFVYICSTVGLKAKTE